MKKDPTKQLKNVFSISQNSYDDESIKENDIPRTEPADFEAAITATGFGKFNLLVLLIAIPSGWASMFEATTISYIIPVAQCDLDMSLNDKGLLISIVYLGMLTSAMVWGFLADTLGRKKLLVIGYLLDAFFVFLSGISQTFPMMVFSKFMGGFIINGPFAVFTAYLSEFHSAKYRAKIVLGMGIVFSAANLLLPLFAWSLLPKDINLFIGDKFVIHSWNIFILSCGLPSLISGIVYIFCPESPKFLMTQGKNDEALEVFKRVYSLNTGKSPETFPIKILVDEIALNNKNEKYHHITANRSKAQAFAEGFAQMKPLFFKPHVAKMLLVSLIQVGSMMGLNTLRLWLPQIFTIMNDYNVQHESSASLCIMLEAAQQPNLTITEECYVNTDNASVYTNAMIVSVAAILGYTIAGTLINALGKKRILVILGLISGSCGMSIYFAQNSETTIALSAIFTALSGINTNVVLTVVIDLFPTSLRTMAVAITMMMGRGGAMVGNLIFPFLIESGCLPPFLFIGLSTLGCAFLAIFLPKTDMKALE